MTGPERDAPACPRDPRAAANAASAQLDAAARRRSPRRADPHGPVPAHQRPERRPGVHVAPRAFPTWERGRRGAEAAVADAIRSGGLANTKAPRIQAILARGPRSARALTTCRGSARMTDAEARGYLTSLPGIGPKTAAVVLSFALGRDTIPVDTHVHRVARRLGLVPAEGERRARRPVAARPRSRRAADPVARGADPSRPRDLQGADAQMRALSTQGLVSDGSAVPAATSAAPGSRPDQASGVGSAGRVGADVMTSTSIVACPPGRSGSSHPTFSWTSVMVSR